LFIEKSLGRREEKELDHLRQALTFLSLLDSWMYYGKKRGRERGSMKKFGVRRGGGGKRICGWSPPNLAPFYRVHQKNEGKEKEIEETQQY